MKVIKNKQIEIIDWDFSDQLNQQGNLIFPYSFYQENKAALLSRSEPTGLFINGDISLELIAKDLNKFALIALDFPNFADGRCFSHAQLLRSEYQYEGDLMAAGDILRDQVEHLFRCGFNIIQFDNRHDINDALNSLTEFTTPYQTSSDQQPTILQLR